MRTKFTPPLWGCALLVSFVPLAQAQTVPAPAPLVGASGTTTNTPNVDAEPLTLDQAIGIAFANHGDVSAAQQAALSAGQRVTSARSSLYPQANVTVGSNLGQGTTIVQTTPTTPGTGTGTDPGTVTTSTSYVTSTQTNFGLSQTIYDGGRLRSTVRQARANSSSAQAGVGVARQTLAFTVASNFYEQLRQERLVAQRSQQVDLAAGQLEQIEAQIVEGTAARVDAQSVRVTLSQARFDLTTARNALNAAQTNLRNALGLPRGQALRLQESSDVAALSESFAPLSPEQTAAALKAPGQDIAEAEDDAGATVPAPLDETTGTETEADVPAEPAPTPVPLRVPPLASLGEYVAAAQQRRPDLQQSRAAILSGEAAVAIAKAAQKPQLGLTAGYNLQNIYNSGRGLTAGLSVSLPLLDAGGRRADVKAAQSDLEATRTRLTQLEKDVAAEVQTAYVNVSGAVERISNAQALVESARQNLEAATGKYQAGVGIVLDVVNAQTQFAQAQTSATTAIYDYQIALADLTRATGLFALGSTQTTPVLDTSASTTTPQPTDTSSATPAADAPR